MRDQTLKSLTYVSRRARPFAQGDADVDAILAVSRLRNAALSVTGALLAARATFAQLIEGPPPAIDALMDSINRDPRHTDIKIVSVKRVTQRMFPSWTLAYDGDEYYVDSQLQRLLRENAPAVFAENVTLLEKLMLEFSRKLEKP